MKTLLLSLLSILLNSFGLTAQSHLQKVQAYGGAYSSIGSFNHACTIGETAVSRFITINFNGTTGFLTREDLFITTDMKEKEFVKELSIFPNPNCGLFTLSFKGIVSDATIRVVNTSGQLVYEEENVFLTDKKVFDLSFTPAGFYWIQVLSREFDRRFKIILVK